MYVVGDESPKVVIGQTDTSLIRSSTSDTTHRGSVGSSVNVNDGRLVQVGLRRREVVSVVDIVHRGVN